MLLILDCSNELGGRDHSCDGARVFFSICLRLAVPSIYFILAITHHSQGIQE